jgi:hypothetical protein
MVRRMTVVSEQWRWLSSNSSSTSPAPGVELPTVETAAVS